MMVERACTLDLSNDPELLFDRPWYVQCARDAVRVCQCRKRNVIIMTRVPGLAKTHFLILSLFNDLGV